MKLVRNLLVAAAGLALAALIGAGASADPIPGQVQVSKVGVLVEWVTHD